jgi:ribosome-binding ATPase YchF (GTP1/OBG family)
MGNQFLNDIAAADALIIVVDVSGRTDPMGNPCQNCDPSADIKMVLEELAAWLSDIIKRHIKDGSGEGLQGSLAKALAGLKVSDESIEKAVKNSGVSAVKSSFTDADLFSLAKAILSESKPFIIAANKADIGGHSDNLERLKKEYGGANVVACSAAVSLAVNKAVAQGIIEKGADGKIALLKKGIPEEQERAVSFIKDFIERNGDGVQTLINKVYLEVLNNIVVYPVEDEHRFTDHFGNVLPDAILLKKGGTALDLAREIHTEIAEKMLYAIDARTKMRIAKDHVLNDGDIIKIVSAAGKA